MSVIFITAAARLLRSWVRIQQGAWMFVVCVVCCQVEVSVTCWSLVQTSPADCDSSLCVIHKPHEWGGHGPRWAAAPQEKKNYYVLLCWSLTLMSHIRFVSLRFPKEIQENNTYKVYSIHEKPNTLFLYVSSWTCLYILFISTSSEPTRQ